MGSEHIRVLIYIGSLKYKLRFEDESKNRGGICTVHVVELVYQHLYGLAVQAGFYRISSTFFLTCKQETKYNILDTLRKLETLNAKCIFCFSYMICTRILIYVYPRATDKDLGQVLTTRYFS